MTIGGGEDEYLHFERKRSDLLSIICTPNGRNQRAIVLGRICPPSHINITTSALHIEVSLLLYTFNRMIITQNMDIFAHRSIAEQHKTRGGVVGGILRWGRGMARDFS